MIWRRWALLCWLPAIMFCAERAQAGSWELDPLLGAVGDYSTNPGLFHQRDTAVGSGALQVDLPTTFVDDALRLSVQPGFRIGDSRGYSSVASNYEHLNVKAEYDSETSTLTATGGLARDSSLAYNYLTSGSTGVRRDGASGDLNWDLHLTERLEVDADGSSQRALFADPLGVATLTDFNFNSITPTLSWRSSERGKLTLSAGASRYDSLNSRDAQGYPLSSTSRSANAQLGFVHQLSELWTLTASAGYSRALDEIDLNQYVCCILVNTPQGLAFALEGIPVKSRTAQNGSVYVVNLSRQAERFSLSATASRQLTPTGFAFLSRQDSYDLQASYTMSERWSFSGDARFQRYQNPPVSGSASNVDVQYYSLQAHWAWTEHLTLSLAAARVANTILSTASAPQFSVASNEVTLTLSRQFNPITF